LRGRALELLTRDHSYAAELGAAGGSATPEAREAAAKWAHVLTRCLNGEPDADADTYVVACEPGACTCCAPTACDPPWFEQRAPAIEEAAGEP